MNPALSSLIFTPDGHLSDERDVLAALREVDTLPTLEREFYRALYGSAELFRSFCREDSAENTQIFKLRCFTGTGAFRYAFCEKNSLLGTPLVFVFLGESVRDFFPMMSPSAHFSGDETSVASFSLISRTPCLAESVFGERASSRYCDLFRLTEALLKRAAQSPMTAKLRLTGAADDSPLLLDIPVEAYAALFSLLVTLLSSVSSSHAIDIALCPFSYAADVVFSTVCDRFGESFRLSPIRILDAVSDRYELIRLADTLSHLAQADLSLSFDRDASLLEVTLGLGYEMQAVPDFKYSDPFEHLDAVFAELEPLLFPALPSREQDKPE